jgi:hypothetical protein
MTRFPRLQVTVNNALERERAALILEESRVASLTKEAEAAARSLADMQESVAELELWLEQNGAE